MEIDHYAVLGLPSGKEGSNLSIKQITKAYRLQSRLRHPDKCPDNPNATADFQRLKSSFDFLKDPISRAAFDSLLRESDESECDSDDDVYKDWETTLKLKWEIDLVDYTAAMLQKIFEKYGDVEQVVMSSYVKGSAIVVMETKDAAIAAERDIRGNRSIPLSIFRVAPVYS